MNSLILKIRKPFLFFQDFDRIARVSQTTKPIKMFHTDEVRLHEATMYTIGRSKGGQADARLISTEAASTR